MTRYNFTQIVDIGQIKRLLEAHFKITGILSAILDADENILVAVGWQELCTRFHRTHPVASKHCRESDAYIKRHLHDCNNGYLDYRCKNGLRDLAVPIIIRGRHLATFFTGQFFYDDDKPDLDFFRAQAREFGFDEEAYLEAVKRVPVITRDHVQTFMEYNLNLVLIMAETGLKNLKLAEEVKKRKNSEAKLEETGDFLEKVMDSIADPIFVKDRKHRLLLVNKAECDLAGKSRAEMIGKTDYDFFPREQVDIFWEKDNIVFKTGLDNANEEEITDAHGESRVIVTKKNLFKGKSGNNFLVGIIRDVTDLKRAETEIRVLNDELEQRISQRTAQLATVNEQLSIEIAERKRIIEELLLTQSCVDNASIGIFRISEEGRILFVNNCAAGRLGYTQEELCSMTIFDIDPTFNPERFREHRHWLRSEGTRAFETMHKCKDGSTFPVEITVNLLEHQGKTFSVSFAKEITDRKLAERRLGLMNFAFDRVHEAAYLVDEQGRFLYVNEGACKALGYGREELLDMGVPDIDPLYPHEEWPAVLRDLKKHGAITFESMHKTRDGHVFPVEMHVNYFDYEGRSFSLGLARDITERKLFEEKLRKKRRQLEELNSTLHKRVEEEVAKNREKDIILIQQNRQAALGETLEHIAHQWKQPLNMIGIIIQSLNVTYSRGELDGEQVDQVIRETMSVIDHMARTIDVFRDFYRPEREKTLFFLKDSVEKALSLIKPAYRHQNIVVECTMDAELSALGYPNEFAQVLLIILTNARDVFRERKTEAPRLSLKVFADGKKGVVTITDNAGGIPEKVIGKVFDLYFTTKQATGGTGIGLYMAKKIMERHMRGSISVANVENGAQFRIEMGVSKK